MTTIDWIHRRRRDAEQPVETEAVVWVCSECFDIYDAATADGNCPNPGHAPVRLHPTHVRATPAARRAPVPDRLPLRPVSRLRQRSKAA
jgi:hypothetical protein